MGEIGVPGVSYRLVLPPGWIMLQVRDRSDAELRALIIRQYAHLPRDSAGPYIARLADQVIEAVSATRAANVTDVVLPLGTSWLAPISASIALAVSPGELPDEGETLETEAGSARRTQTEHPADALRRVEYLWQIPGGAGQLLLATFSVVGSDDPELLSILDALTELCDMMLATLRWEIDGETGQTDPPTGVGHGTEEEG